jgi:hypothetical protein
MKNVEYIKKSIKPNKVELEVELLSSFCDLSSSATKYISWPKTMFMFANILKIQNIDEYVEFYDPLYKLQI